jgi:3-oxoacyl-[acyl-carrier protein] reductase
MPQDIQAALAGQVAIVTGGSRNIGRAISLRLAAEGAAVAVVGRSDGAAAEAVAGEITEAGGRAMARLADVTDETGVGALVDEVAAAYGRVDILVNNAAVRRRQPLDSMTLAQWREITGVILDGAFLCARACVPHMIAAGAGSIVNIGGLGRGVRGPGHPGQLRGAGNHRYGARGDRPVAAQLSGRRARPDRPPGPGGGDRRHGRPPLSAR